MCQKLQAPDKTSGFGHAIAISDDGTLITVSAPLNDDYLADQGVVYVYKQVNGVFELSQTLNSPNNERSEMFGWRLEFDGKKLHVSSKNADTTSKTYFDNFTTAFDSNFTTFTRTNDDAGVVCQIKLMATILVK